MTTTVRSLPTERGEVPRARMAVERLKLMPGSPLIAEAVKVGSDAIGARLNPFPDWSAQPVTLLPASVTPTSALYQAASPADGGDVTRPPVTASESGVVADSL